FSLFIIVPKSGLKFPAVPYPEGYLTKYRGTLIGRRIDQNTSCMRRSTHQLAIRSEMRTLCRGRILVKQKRPCRPLHKAVVSRCRRTLKFLRKHLHVIPGFAIVVDDGKRVQRRKITIEGIPVVPVIRLINRLRTEI